MNTPDADAGKASAAVDPFSALLAEKPCDASPRHAPDTCAYIGERSRTAHIASAAKRTRRCEARVWRSVRRTALHQRPRVRGWLDITGSVGGDHQSRWSF